ncbi:MAG: Vitamin B12 ABC transporter, B12-binding component BtuF [uncultured Gemmatimonadetes bacterium]|uniref:Vitamin B12 ABC transporter, B12-binding component BtuF n=1 Tax=uncultured Gemmatimonadota bacterium TaxID=203437 RepID=A0A6J4MSK5_9BACT|nr:MAG: Vitamin B12 ABC transporter, B12-binding component BtuF [uncultured Gemmatimonadota bacterium]
MATDDAGKQVRLPRAARRVVSLLPAGTETLVALGAGDRIVGRTRYDDLPEVAHLPSVGGGLDPSLEALVALQPDLVLAFETAGGSRIRARLEELGIPVFAIAPQDTTDIFRNLERLGQLVGRDAAADSIARHVRAELDAVRSSVRGRQTPTVFYVVGIDPPMTAGPQTFISQLIGVAGGRTSVPDVQALWPQISLEEIVHRQPDIVLLPVGKDSAASLARLRSEPGWRELRAVQQGRIATVPADLMNRPGPRIGEAARRLRQALHPASGATRP